MVRRRRSAPVSVLRSRLNQRLSETKPQKHKSPRLEKTETTGEKKKFFFMSFSLSFMRSMNSYFYLKMAIALIIVLSLGISQQMGWTWTGRIIEGTRYVVTWDMDLQYIQDRVVPVVKDIDTNDLLQKVSFMNSENENLLLVNGELKSGFGLRENPQSGLEEMHYGIDIISEEGAIVRAVLPGEVIVLEKGENGSTIIIEHEKGWSSVYEKIEEARVVVGDVVSESQVLGILGPQRNWDSPHLHFELRWNGRPHDPLIILGDMYETKPVVGQISEVGIQN